MLAATLLAAGCGATKPVAPDAKPTPVTALDADTSASNIVTVDLGGGVDPSYGATPMAERVATLGLLNKRNGAARDVVLKPGKAMRIGDVVVRLRACERTAPWEQEQYTGAFVQVDVQGSDASWRRAFSGWLFKERPALNVVQHPIYDVWIKSCAMTFPLGGPDSVAGGGAPGSNDTPRSSAKKSPAAVGDAPEPTTPEIAADNATR
ncbi:glycosyl hydrolase family 5 [Sphingomonas psychrolutea]|uniref:Glycosyl hydrolase family 5 n=1 Tax=Sphingomonas psychrolutea TaxID=1259676 RepID=A0ABQ1GDG4_9SPHN|nr:glycosyl hydrolase family 5 [Sphingomonas psychrolutea]